MKAPRRRAGGRGERLRQRSAPPANNPCPPGAVGGRYTPLLPEEIAAIYETALRLLSEIGMGDVPERLAKDLVRAGGERDAAGRIHMPRAMVEDTVAGAAQRFVLHGRDEARSIEVGGERVHFGTGGAAVQTLDLDTGLYRPSTLKDLHAFARLADGLQNISWFTRCCVPTDVPDVYEMDLNTVYAIVRNTSKPIGTSFTLAEHIPDAVALLNIAAGGGDGAFARRPFCKAHISPVISPLKFGEDAIDVIYGALEHNFPLNCIIAAQSGATAPATLAGFLAQSTAETLASLVAVNAIRPGHPMIFSNWPFVVDLRTGSFSGGGGEIAVMNAASAQIANWLGLPSGVASSMTDAKALDAQYGAEKGLTALAAGLSGANLVYESAGMTASLLGASFEGFVIDNDMLGSIYRMLRGIEVTEESLAFDTIRDVVEGEGHFLGADHTYAAMERDYFYPPMADRDPPVTWHEKGAPDIWRRANAQAREILAEPDLPRLPDGADAEIRSRFRIH